jgi:hypothetical protein
MTKKRTMKQPMKTTKTTEPTKWLASLASLPR